MNFGLVLRATNNAQCAFAIQIVFCQKWDTEINLSLVVVVVVVAFRV